MEWTVLFAEAFEAEYFEFRIEVRREIYAFTQLLRKSGPHLGRPHVDTLKGARHANMKEARFKVAGGVWRMAFAFDPERRAILLIAGDKSGVSEKRFYQELIRKADHPFARHLDETKKERI
jgi:hypothetical protein